MEKIRLKLLLMDYLNTFSTAKGDEDLLRAFCSLFTSPKNYWRHVLKHAIPRRVKRELSLNTWRDTERNSQKLPPYQKSYALSFLATLAYPEKVALVISSKSEFDRIVFFSTKRRMAVILEPTGEVASVCRRGSDRWRVFENCERDKKSLSSPV